MKVKECMCNDVCFVNPDNTVSDAAKIMCGNHVGCVPVCNSENQVVGLVTDRDIILRSIACDKDVKQTPISEIMSCNVCCCGPEEEIENAEKKMSDLQIRRIPVVENNKIVGILTLGDLAKNKNLDTQKVCNTLENICCSNNQKNAD